MGHGRYWLTGLAATATIAGAGLAQDDPATARRPAPTTSPDIAPRSSPSPSPNASASASVPLTLPGSENGATRHRSMRTDATSAPPLTLPNSGQGSPQATGATATPTTLPKAPPGQPVDSAAAVDAQTAASGPATGSAPVTLTRTADGAEIMDSADRLYPLASGAALITGCPAALAQKYDGCIPPDPPTQRAAVFDRPSFYGLTNLPAGDFRYDQGYLVRLGQDGAAAGYIPLLGGALSLGQTWPSYYRQRGAPDYYRNFFDLGSPASYRYANDVIYRVDPETAAITSIAALLTGDEIDVGDTLPAAYGVYNVPYRYQERYRDGPDTIYRYADGYVYRAGAGTRRVQAVIELLS